MKIRCSLVADISCATMPMAKAAMPTTVAAR